MRTFKRILGVLLIFFFGVFVGAMVANAGAWQKFMRTVVGGPEAVVDVVVWRLDHELKLDSEQKRKVQGIVDDARIRLRQSHAKIQPEIEETLHDAEERTRAILYPQQVKKFDEIVAKSRERWKAPAAAKKPAPAKATPEPEGTPVPPAPQATPEGAAPTTPVPIPAEDKR
jgi:hypothetical protein